MDERGGKKEPEEGERGGKEGRKRKRAGGKRKKRREKCIFLPLHSTHRNPASI